MSRKRMNSLAALTLAVAVLFTGCTGGDKKDPPKEIDMATLSTQLKEGAKFEGSLQEMTEKVVEKRYDLTNVAAYVVCLEPSGGFAEEVSIFKANEGKVAEVEQMVADHLESRRKEFENYVPAETFKIDNAVVTTQGDYVMVVIAQDVGASQETFEKAFA